MPVSQFLAPSSAPFVSYLVKRVRPIRLVNFGDLQNLLFPTAENTCHIFLGSCRDDTTRDGIPFDETFDYCVPKADLSLAYGRLTMQSADRHMLQDGFCLPRTRSADHTYVGRRQRSRAMDTAYIFWDLW